MEHAKTIVGITAIIAEAVSDAGEIPEGHLYAMCMGMMTLAQMQNILTACEKTGIITRQGNLLKAGPTAEAFLRAVSRP